MQQEIRINKYLPIAILYFFFNGFLLPIGLLYTTLLTPLLLIWLSRHPSIKYLRVFFFVTIPFAIIHFSNGVNMGYYFRSYLLLFSVFVFALSFYHFVKVCQSLKSIYSSIIYFNFILVLLAIIALYIPGLHETLWLIGSVSSGIEGVDRLRLFTYEPSYYSTLLVPIALYYYLKFLIQKTSFSWAILFIITLPLILSFSFGVISAMISSLFLLSLFNVRNFVSNRKTALYVITSLFVSSIFIVILLLLFPDNFFVLRFNNVLEGKDSSFIGRTYDAFYLGWKIAEMKSILFGSGLGQTKVLGLDLWTKYYAYNFTINQIAIPNVIGDTLAVYGLVGVFIRIGLQIYFFFRTKVFNNYYRLALFIFIFIYQFTGSFLYNIAEYVIWILAFVNVFDEFDKKKNQKG